VASSGSNNVLQIALNEGNQEGPLSRSTQHSLRLGRPKILTYSSLEEYINEKVLQEEGDMGREKFKCYSIKMIVRFFITLASLWNVVFIPLSFAFRVPFEGVILAFEVLTVFFYLIDLGLLWSKFNRMN